MASASPYSNLSTIQKRILSGLVSTEFDQTSVRTNPRQSISYFPTSDDGCPKNLGSNIKVNQNCLNITDPDLQGRGQAQNETAIAVDPNNSNHLVAGYNDYRRGDGMCGSSYSLDNGRTWTDTSIPMGFTRGAPFGAFARKYWEAGGDTSVAWDSRGNAYMSCQVFNRGVPAATDPDMSSALLVFRSTHNDGAAWNFPGRYAATQINPGPSLIPLLDKPYMTVDNHSSSPFRDRIYVTWTLFAADGSAYIFESHSSDYGETFSAPVVVSVNSPTLCTVTFGAGTPFGNCNQNQDSDPFTGPDGALYVVYDNFNNAVKGLDNRNQILLSKSTDGGNTFSPPVKVSDYYDLPDCATYQGGQDFGRACVPEKGSSMRSVFRATNYPTGAVNPTKTGQIVVTFGSYINVHSNEANGCIPAGFAPSGNNDYTGVKTPGACNNDILISVSNDGGATFTGTTADPRAEAVVTTAPGQATTDQWWQWEAFTKNGKLAVSYYDRQYGTDETTGFSDMSLSSSGDLTDFDVERVTSGSMPPPTEFPDAQGNSVFFGDYSGLDAHNNAHPIWMDTRSLDLFLCPGTGAPGVPPAICGATEPGGQVANDQDIFTANVGVSSK